MKILSNFQYILEEASKKGIDYQPLKRYEDISFFSNGKKRVYVYGRHLPFNNSVGPKISKDKNLTKEVLSFYGISTPVGVLATSLSEVLKKIEGGVLRFPLVIKPNDKALGEDVYAPIDDEEELEKFLKISLSTNKKALVENYHEGDDFRFLVLNYRVIGVARRERPYVIGDGIKTLEELIGDLDSKRERKVTKDSEFERIINKQSVNLKTIIDEGEKIILRGNCNFRTGGILTDVTDEVSDFYKKIAVDAAKALTLRFCGVDILMSEFRQKSDYVVTEVNSVPGLDAHMAVDFGKGIDVAEIVLKEMFLESENG